MLCRDPSNAEKAMSLYTDMFEGYFNVADDLTSQFNELLDYTKGGLRHTFKFDHRLRRAAAIDEPSLPTIVTSNASFECPIVMDDTDAALLIRDIGSPLLTGFLEANQVDDVLNCPLNAMNYPQFMNALQSALDAPVGLAALQGSGGFEESPYSRMQLIGAVYLGAHKSQVAATNHTLAKLLSGGKAKKTGNMDLWFAVLRRAIANVERLRELQVHTDTHMKHRLEHSQTWASLIGLPQYLSVVVPLGVACWTIAAAPLLEHMRVKQDAMRAHVFHMPGIFELMDLYGAHLPRRSDVERHAMRLQTLFKMLHTCKKCAKFQERALALVQRCVKAGDAWIPIDGPADDQQKQLVVQEMMDSYGVSHELDARELACLASLVDPQKSVDDISLPLNWTPEPPSHIVSWPNYGLSTESVVSYIPICCETARPYYHVDGQKTWGDAFIETYHFDKAQCIPGCVWYINYIAHHNQFPNIDQFIQYCMNRCRNRKIKTLPAPFVQFAQELLDSYEPLCKTMTTQEMTRRAAKSACIADRIVLEKACAS